MDNFDVSPLQYRDLFSVFAKHDNPQEKIGVEVEVGTVRPFTGLSIPYENGVNLLLQALRKEFDGEPILEGGNIVGVSLSDGGQLGLEHHGALEYSSRPFTSITEAVITTLYILHQCADVAKSLDIALLTGGNFPFSTFKDVNWMPLLRGPIMRNYLMNLGEMGALGQSVMGFALSTQVTLDYLDEEDLVRKLKMLTTISPVAAALFVNSPLQGGKVSGVLSRRMQYWDKFDPERCGFIPVTLNPRMEITDFVDWAIEKPMIFRNHNGQVKLAPRKSFSTFLNDGFGDGTFPNYSDWVAHLSQIWTDVRLRNTIELRIMDGQSFLNIPAVLAFWVGLTYHPPSCKSAWDLMKGRTLTDHKKARQDVAINGLKAKHGQDSIHELAIELVKLAKLGLMARVKAGLEPSSVLNYLTPVEDVVSSGKTFAEQCIEHWQNDMQMVPSSYVKAFQI